MSEMILNFREIAEEEIKRAVSNLVIQKHGYWVFSENDDMFYCTNCKNGSVRNDYPYCHWCGAKMDALAKDINVHCKTDEVTE